MHIGNSKSEKEIFVGGDMADIVWSEKYETQIFEIDEQHKKLVEILNNLTRGYNEQAGAEVYNKTFKELIDYTSYHFSTEEKLMENSGYNDLDKHKLEHEDLLWQVLDYKKRYEIKEEDIEKKIVEFLNDWLMKHILGSDKRFGQYYKKYELGE